MSLAACAERVERGDPDRFLATMAAAPEARARLFPLYAFNLEVSRAPWVTAEPMIAEMRLQWWRDALAEIRAGQAVRAHEITVPLAEVVGEAGLSVAVLDALVEARRWDIYREPFEDRAAFDAYLEDTAAGLMWSAACALGAPPQAEDAVRAYGWASGLASFLRAVPALEAEKRVPLVDGRPEAVAALARQGMVRIDDARAARRSVPSGARPALWSGWQAPAILRQAAERPAEVAAGTLGQSEFRRRAGLLMRSMTGRF